MSFSYLTDKWLDENRSSNRTSMSTGLRCKQRHCDWGLIHADAHGCHGLLHAHGCCKLQRHLDFWITGVAEWPHRQIIENSDSTSVSFLNVGYAVCECPSLESSVPYDRILGDVQPWRLCIVVPASPLHLDALGLPWPCLNSHCWCVSWPRISCCCGFRVEVIERGGRECLDVHVSGGIVLAIIFLRVYHSWSKLLYHLEKQKLGFQESEAKDEERMWSM